MLSIKRNLYSHSHWTNDLTRSILITVPDRVLYASVNSFFDRVRFSIVERIVFHHEKMDLVYLNQLIHAEMTLFFKRTMNNEYG